MTRDIPDILSRARDYPYDFPRRSYTYLNGETAAFDHEQTAGRVPVLAIGSNQSPIRLKQKYGHLDNQLIPVQRANLTDFDIFYCAHVTAYGAIGAMLQHSPGRQVELAVTWLNRDQLEIMHATEGNYDFSELTGLTLAFQDGGTTDRAYVYVGQNGHMIRNAGPVPMAAIACESRSEPAFTTAQLLQELQAVHDNALSEEAFILKLVEDRSYRLSITRKLAENAVPFSYPYHVVDSATAFSNL